MQMENNSCHLL